MKKPSVGLLRRSHEQKAELHGEIFPGEEELQGLFEKNKDSLKMLKFMYSIGEGVSEFWAMQGCAEGQKEEIEKYSDER